MTNPKTGTEGALEALDQLYNENSEGLKRLAMIESLHTIVKKYVDHSTADDICQDITGWLYRNYQKYPGQPIVDKICDDIWESCRIADKSLSRKDTDDYFEIIKND